VKKKGIIVAVFFGVILLTSTVAIALPNLMPPTDTEETTVTGTPADNFPDSQRGQFCGTGEPKSNAFVTEYRIPTECTQPLAITTTPDGFVWFAQANTGNIAKFDPNSGTFTEYDNPRWPQNGRSMIWDMDYSPDGRLWYTDEAYDSIWIFSIQDQKFERLQYPSEGNSLPQKLEVSGSQIIVNDFTGNKLTILDPTQSEEGLVTVSLPSEVTAAVTADFAIDNENNIWYTNWVFQQSGVLVKFNQDEFLKSGGMQNRNYTEAILLPPSVSTPNGAAADNNGNIWLADTSSSSFFKFDIDNEEFVQYFTSTPAVETFGNQSGIIKSPISRPYWIEASDDGKIVFNEQTGNRIGVMDPSDETLIEYSVPSKNRFWGDCGEDPNCGLAQVFDFTVDGEKIWFTEWVENNIGVIDTSIPLPMGIDTETEMIKMRAGETQKIEFVINPKTESDLFPVFLITEASSGFLTIKPDTAYSDIFSLDFDAPRVVGVELTSTEGALPGIYKVLLGAETPEVSVSKFVTVQILP